MSTNHSHFATSNAVHYRDDRAPRYTLADVRELIEVEREAAAAQRAGIAATVRRCASIICITMGTLFALAVSAGVGIAIAYQPQEVAAWFR